MTANCAASLGCPAPCPTAATHRQHSTLHTLTEVEGSQSTQRRLAAIQRLLHSRGEAGQGACQRLARGCMNGQRKAQQTACCFNCIAGFTVRFMVQGRRGPGCGARTGHRLLLEEGINSIGRAGAWALAALASIAGLVLGHSAAHTSGTRTAFWPLTQHEAGVEGDEVLNLSLSSKGWQVP